MHCEERKTRLVQTPEKVLLGRYFVRRLLTIRSEMNQNVYIFSIYASFFQHSDYFVQLAGCSRQITERMRVSF